MKKYLFLIVFIVLNSFAQLFAQAFENGQLYVYVLNPNSIPTFEKDTSTRHHTTEHSQSQVSDQIYLT